MSPEMPEPLAFWPGCPKARTDELRYGVVWLAPELQREILEFPPTATVRFPVSEVAVRRIAGILTWEEQQRVRKKLLAHGFSAHHLRLAGTPWIEINLSLSVH